MDIISESMIHFRSLCFCHCPPPPPAFSLSLSLSLIVTRFAFDVDEETMSETMLAQHTVDTIRNLSLAAEHAASTKGVPEPPPFFLAVGFHKV